MQNYERVRQAMLLPGQSVYKYLFPQARHIAEATNQKQSASNFLAELKNKAMTQSKKKRMLDEVSKDLKMTGDEPSNENEELPI